MKYLLNQQPCRTRLGQTLRCLAFVIPLLLFVSCSDLLGYSVVLWSMKPQGLDDGDIVPVYLKSTISQVYVIALPYTGEKIEVPLWQITPPASKKKAEKQREIYMDYQHQYAVTMLDGLPIRSQAVNTARQVYRLRKDEIVKVLYKGEGQPVMAGATPMEGDWLRILTSDGTEGWCFSHNLRLFDNRNQGEELTESFHTEIAQTELAEVFKKNWQPEFYQPMLLNNTVDLSQMNADYGFMIDLSKKTGRLRLANVNLPFEYTAIIKGAELSYTLEGSPISLIVQGDDLLIVSVTNSRGIPVSYNFIPIDEPVIDILNREIERRAALFDSLLSFGPNFISEDYGSLEFLSGNNVIWNGESGTVEFKYFISERLRSIFDGVITIRFAGSENERNFFYSVVANGIQFEDASSVSPQGNIFTSRSANPAVMFFEKTN